jgi:hypothetical protein
MIGSFWIEPAGDGIYQTVGYVGAAAFYSDVIPDIVKVEVGFWCTAMCH